MHTVTRTGNGSRIAIGEGRLKPCSELTSRICVDPANPPVTWLRCQNGPQTQGFASPRQARP